jgi:hypothetical protein
VRFGAPLLALHGYATLALAYFGLPGLPRGLVNIPLEYFGKAIAHVRAAIAPRNDFVAVHTCDSCNFLAAPRKLGGIKQSFRMIPTKLRKAPVFAPACQTVELDLLRAASGQIAFGFLEKFADGRVAIAHDSPRDVKTVGGPFPAGRASRRATVRAACGVASY